MTWKLWIPLLALPWIALAQQPMPAGFTSLSNVRSIEIRDLNDQVVLQGSFKTNKDEGEVETSLTGVAVGSKANGKARIAIDKDDGAISKQELQLKLERLQRSATFKVIIDGKEFATVATDNDGKANLNFTSKSR